MDGNAATFSALRSSSQNQENKSSNRKKPRAKSATQMKVSFSDKENSTRRPKSASPRTKAVRQNPKEKSSFMKSALNMDSDQKNEFINSRQSYDKWVRSNNTPEVKRKKTKRDTNTNQHNPLDNELISELAKRRIKNILNSQKRVDSGIGRPKTAPAKIKTNSTENEKEGTKYKWRLRDADAAAQNHAKIKKKTEENSRPKFSFIKKTSSKSTAYDRNPVLRRALYENPAPA